MDINSLISIIKKKITKDVICESLKIEDKSFLHKNHTGNDNTKFHIKLSIQSQQLKEMGRVESDKKIYKILNDELSTSIHSLQILIH